MRLKDIRLSQGISVPKLAELTGISRRTIQDIEKRGDCLVSNALVLAKALNVTMDEMCGNIKESNDLKKGEKNV